MSNNKLESLAWRLENIDNLKELFRELNFDNIDKPVNKEYWSQDQKNIVQEARIIAAKNDYNIYYIKTNSDSLSKRKAISSKIIKEKLGLCLICSHNPHGNKWIFSSLSKEFSKSFSESRHIPIDIKEDTDVPKTFVNFLGKIQVNQNSTATSIHSQVSNAFDECSLQIHNELTVNVFEAYKSLTEGIIIDKNNNFELVDENLEKIRSPVFILLYRLIFVLYAESRDIFETDNATYYQKFSLEWIKKNWVLDSKSASKLQEYEVQNRLKSLFHLIEVGSDALELTTKEFSMISYYGRLFDRDIHKELEKWKIPNKQILDAISFITRTNDGKNYFFLDYSALKTRHLGSIYEHLLEYHLTTENGKISQLPDPEDRKKSASYYTPDFVVDHIVENTIEPKIKTIIKNFPDKITQIEKILNLKILDPAMGSGHFLIGVVNYLAKRLCEIEFGEIHEIDLIEKKREVVRKCIYGVDLNPLAVDLASVALWLETLSLEKPLSFLQAHLKNGNSLLGSNIDKIFNIQHTITESQKGREYFKKSVKEFLMFEDLEDDTGSAVKTKVEKYKKMRLRGTINYDLNFLLNCRVAEQFGVEIPPLGDFTAKIGKNSLDYFMYDKWPEIKKMSESKKFFHWELEFPEIFYDIKGNKKKDPGFDIIIKNPPYEKTIYLEDEKPYYSKKFVSTYGSYDILILFIEQSINLVKGNGHIGFIVSNKFLVSDFGKKIRKIILSKTEIKTIMDLSDSKRIFKDALVSPAIIILKKINPNKEYFINRFIANKDTIGFDSKEFDTIAISKLIAPNGTFNVRYKPENDSIYEKIARCDSFDSVGFNVRTGIMGFEYWKMAEHITNGKQNKNDIRIATNSYLDQFKVLWGKQVKFYKKDFNEPYTDVKKLPISDGTRKLFLTKNKLVVRGVAQRLTAILDTEGIGFLVAIHSIICNEKYPSQFVLGLLNSDFFNWIHKDRFYLGRIPEGSLKYPVSFLKELPIPSEISRKNKENMIIKVEQMNSLMIEQDIVKKNQKELEIIDIKIENIYKEINQLTYNIFGITDNEISIINSKL